MASFPPVRSVKRVLRLLQCFNRQPVSTLDVLHQQTGLLKPSLIRLLQTLIGMGLVRHAPQYGAYYVTSAVQSLPCGFHSKPRIISSTRTSNAASWRTASWRLRCADCGHDKLLAFSCKRRGFCPSCGARCMSQTAAHLVDHVIPRTASQCLSRPIHPPTRSCRRCCTRSSPG